MKKLDCTIVVLTYNEEANLSHLLESVAPWAAAVYIVDSGSTDGTLEMAKGFGAQVFHHAWTSHADQFNWALDTLPITTDWLMRMDADERVTHELAQEIQEILPTLPDQVTGLYVKRRVYFMGRWIRHGSYYPTWLLRVFRRGRARCENLRMDEHIIVLDGTTRHLKHDIIDENRKGLAFWTLKHESYANQEIIDLFDTAPSQEGSVIEASLLGTQAERKRWLKGNVYARSPLFLRALAYFIYRYVFRLGFLDGMEGLIFHVLQGFWYRFYVDAKFWEKQHPPKDP